MLVSNPELKIFFEKVVQSGPIHCGVAETQEVIHKKTIYSPRSHQTCPQ